MTNARKALLLGLVLALAGGIAYAQVSFSKYEALGDSLTAGYASGALTEFYQDYSYPAILARQFGISDFEQPIISDPGIGSYGTVLQLFQLQFSPTTGVVPVIGPAPGAPGQPINATYPGIYNNLGIPGANTVDLLTKTGDITKLLTGNIDPNTIMYDIVLRDGQHTALEQAIGAAPTFVTVWAGNNDVLGGATSGVAVDGVTVTPAAQFQQSYTTLIGGLRTQLSSAGIVVATIPDVTAIPFVTTIKPYIVNPADGSHIPAAAGGTGLPLPEGSIDASGLHTGVILRAGEIALLQSRTNELNDIIKAVAAQFGAQVVDIHAIFVALGANGYAVGGIKLTPDFLTGGLLSYDGIHPQRLGYAIVANEFIKVINAGFGAHVPLVNLRPFLDAEGGTTSVMAAKVVFSQEAAISVIKAFTPNALFDTFQTRHVVRRRLSLERHGPLDPAMQ
jgi:lysophospholipase L1-like esterase